VGSLYIQEFRVAGAKAVPRIEVEKAVYPFMGPGRSEQDVEQARMAVEKLYKDRGFQTVEVQVPQQTGRGGIVFLNVLEGKVGRLRVKGSRYFSLSQIKRMTPSLAEGKVVNFNDVTRDIVALNQLPDRRVTPSLRAGVVPGTVDIDLEVKDTFPLHGSLELNNRYSANTTPLRANGSISYNNFWQLGHSAGLSFQVAPEEPDEAKVFSGFYLARFPEIPWFSFILQGTKQDSNVSTLGGAAVAGRGEIIGARAMITLPPGKDFYHSVSLGLDYKHFDQTINLATGVIESPVSYYPLSASYTASWVGKKAQTEFNAGVTMHLRGTGSSEEQFSNSRFKASGSFIYFRGDLSHTHELPGEFQLFAKIQGQLADQPLLSAEQFSGGGVGTARGYLESEVAGDNALFGTLELRTFNLFRVLPWLRDRGSEWRVYSFIDSGLLTLREPLPEQESRFELASIGIGTRVQFAEHYNGSIDLAMPLLTQGQTQAREYQLNFRLWADF
jgi:hemolysin activation/secretion protein